MNKINVFSKIVSDNDSLHDAVDSFLEDGFVVHGGTKQSAVRFMNSLVEALEDYENVVPLKSFIKVPVNGYFYFIYDLNRYSPDNNELNDILSQIDSQV